MLNYNKILMLTKNLFNQRSSALTTLRASLFGSSPLPSFGVRRPAPAFTAKAWTQGGVKEISLSDYKGKYVVLFFYPLDFTFVCPTEIISFSDKAAKFREIGAEVIGASIDSIFSHMEYTAKPRAQGGLGPLDIPLIADVNKSLSTNYRC
jgi:alkyl hydroperoxide reductase subunit AhpC